MKAASVALRHWGAALFRWKGLRLVLCVFIAPCSFFPADAQPQQEAVSFFKRALASPQDVESFTASARTLRERVPPEVKRLMKQYMVTNVTPKVQYFAGARGGSNFFLKQRGLPGETIDGREASRAYNVVSNCLSFGFDGFDPANPAASDRISQASDSAYTLACQFLQMGLGDLDPQTVVWSGSTFLAQNREGRSEYGEVELSNGLPYKLRLSPRKGVSPFKMVVYDYPQDIWSLSGFPAKLTIWAVFDDGLQPFLELALLEVNLAKHPLTSEFFDPAKFVTASILYTNIWTKEKLTGISPHGTGTVTVAALQQGFTRTDRSMRVRTMFYGSIALVTILPIAAYFKNRRNQKQKTNS